MYAHREFLHAEDGVQVYGGKQRLAREFKYPTAQWIVPNFVKRFYLMSVLRLVIAVALMCSFLAAQASPSIVSVKADAVERNGVFVIYSGHVRLETKDEVITANRIRLNEATGQMEANGNVKIQKKERN